MRNNLSSLVRARALLTAALLVVSTLTQATPDVQSWTTAQGTKVLLVENDALPMLDIRVVFDAGSARDGRLSGLALLTNSLLDEGAGGLSAQQLAEEFESVGAEVSLESLRDMAYVGLRTLSDEPYLSRSLATFRKVLTQPDFPKKAFDRQMARFKIAVKSRKQSPSTIASEAFYKALYGDHPYATPVAGTEASLAKIRLEDVRDYYRQYYVAANAVISIVGDVDRAKAEQIIDDLLSGLKTGHAVAALPEVPALQESQTIFIEYPSQQSHIFIGQVGMKRGQQDYFENYVANHPFGGSGFASRLVDVIREQRGLAYSVYSYFSPSRVAGPFIMGMQTKNEQAQQAIDLLNQELRRYVKEGPTDKELKNSVSNITGGFPLGIDSNSKMLGYLAMIGFYDLPVDYLDTFIGNVRAVSRESAHKAFSDLIDPDKMITVVVGQRVAKPD